jgi:molybdenum cofactor biosynthesis enzyme MoaA
MKPGERVRVRFTPRPDCLPVEVWAEVVRETRTGFAVRFTSVDPRLRRLLRSITENAGPQNEVEETQPVVSQDPEPGRDEPS